MTHHRFPRIALFGFSLAVALPGFGQEAPSESEAAARAEVEAQGFRLPPQLRQVAYREANPWVLHTNVRVGSADAKVAFGGLGSIPASSSIPGADVTDHPARVYDDGGVRLDGLRTNEVDDDGNQTSTPGERYQAYDDDGNLVGDYLGYSADQSRDWAFLNESQLGDGVVSMNQFSTASTGAGFQREAESSGLGFEMAASRRLMRLGKKMELGVFASVGFSDFSSSVSESISADLIRMTDVYRIFGEISGSSYEAPTFDVLTDPDTGLIIDGGQLETTVPIQQITPDRTYTTIADGAAIDGQWALDGAYYSFHLGPEVRGHLTEKIALRASVGLLAAVVGSDFNVTEVLDMGDYITFGGVGYQSSDSITEVLIGYYAEAAIEYWITQRTGLFFGAVIESLDDFTHSFGGRTAAVELGEAMVVRFGVVHRF